MNLLRQVKAEAAKRRLRFLLVGGHAVNIHGYSRTTADLDLLICQEDQEAWRGMATLLGYQVEYDGATFLQLQPTDPGGWPLDLMLVNPETFEGLMAAAGEAQLEGESYPVVSLRHLLALKLHALKHTHVGRTLKDFEDVIHLLRIHELNPAAEDFRSLCFKYADAEIHGRIVRAVEA